MKSHPEEEEEERGEKGEAREAGSGEGGLSTTCYLHMLQTLRGTITIAPNDNENANESARIDMDMRVCNLVE